MKHRDPLTEAQTAQLLPHVVTLIAAWTSGDHRQATEDVCDLAIMMVEAVRESMISGRPMLEQAPAYTGTMADAAHALGQKLQPLPKGLPKVPPPAPAEADAHP